MYYAVRNVHTLHTVHIYNVICCNACAYFRYCLYILYMFTLQHIIHMYCNILHYIYKQYVINYAQSLQHIHYIIYRYILYNVLCCNVCAYFMTYCLLALALYLCNLTNRVLHVTAILGSSTSPRSLWLL